MSTQLTTRLRRLYTTDQVASCLARIESLLRSYAPRLKSDHRLEWDQRDVVLITYADQVQQVGQRPLQTLAEFFTAHGLDQLVSTIHVLPFYPSSSDGGFSVIDYRAVEPAHGTWEDIRQLGAGWDLMFDLVLNHTSAHSHWFQEYLRGNPTYQDYFISVPAEADVSTVTRPRSLPLLTPFATAAGPKHLWTTFSADQIDLNFANPDVLVEMLDVLLFYIEQGARIIRLDAVAYLWKTLGTSCIHLGQTHEVIKLYRAVIDAVAPHVLLLTETNVPFAENISYFGVGDEAHMVYQFSLPPLILDALLSQDARPLMGWLADLPPSPSGTTWFNFTASHDGFGLRPLEGILSEQRLQQLVEALRERGGLVSTYRSVDGTDKPYEANITLASALGAPHGHGDDLQLQRILTSQGLMLALQGIPAVYFHSLLGTLNDTEAVTRSGHARDINRRRLSRDEAEAQLADANSMTARVFSGYRNMLRIRRQQPAFHPDAAQRVCATTAPWLVALQRTSVDPPQQLLVLANVGNQPQRLDASTLADFPVSRDLLSGKAVDPRQLRLDAYAIVWLS